MSKYPISLNYFAKYMTLGNLSVGRVTILFKVWQDLAIQGSLYKEAALKEDWKEVNKRARKLNLYLEWLKEALKGGGAKGVKFVAPEEEVVNSATSRQKLLAEKLRAEAGFLAEGGEEISIRRMSDKIAADAVKAAMKMDISIKNFNVVNDHVMEVLGNILAFCRVMNDAARNCQEKTIDATKKFIEVVIPLESPLLLLAYYSRKDVGDEVGASLDFQNGATSVSVNPAKGRKWEDRNGVTHYSFADYDDELRGEALKKATCMDEELYSIQQNVPEVIRRSAEILMARHPDITSFIRLMVKFHITISNIDNVTLADMEKRQVTEEALEAFKKLKEQSRRNLVASLANQIRWFAASHPAKDKSGNLQYAKGYKLALIALGVVLERAAKKEEAGEPGQLSNFAFTVLKEEFILMVIHAVKNHQGIFSEGTPGEIFEEAIEKLDVCDLEDGTTVEFVGGSAVEGNAFCANAKEIPDGVYTIRDLEGRMFACKNIEEAMEAAIPQKISGKFCFMTAEQVVGMPDDAEIFGEDLKAIVDNAKEVILSADVGGHKCAVVANRTIVGAAALPTLVLKNKVANSAAEFFKNKKGVVSYSRALVYRTKSEKWAVRLFVVLEGVKPAVAADHKAAKLAKPMKPIISAPKATLKVSPSVAAALANLQ